MPDVSRNARQCGCDPVANYVCPECASGEPPCVLGHRIRRAWCSACAVLTEPASAQQTQPTQQEINNSHDAEVEDAEVESPEPQPSPAELIRLPALRTDDPKNPQRFGWLRVLTEGYAGLRRCRLD